MSKLLNIYIDAAERELEHYLGVSAEFDTSSRKHSRVTISFNGRSRFVVISGSNRRESTKDFLTDLRVELRALGARRVERPSPTERRTRNVAAPRPTPTPEISDPRPDGWAPLRELHARLSAAAEPALKPRRSIWSALAGVLTGRAA